MPFEEARYVFLLAIAIPLRDYPKPSLLPAIRHLRKGKRGLCSDVATLCLWVQHCCNTLGSPQQNRQLRTLRRRMIETTTSVVCFPTRTWNAGRRRFPGLACCCKTGPEMTSSRIWATELRHRTRRSAVLSQSYLWLNSGIIPNRAVGEESTFNAGALSLCCAGHWRPRDLVPRSHPAPAFALSVPFRVAAILSRD